MSKSASAFNEKPRDPSLKCSIFTPRSNKTKSAFISQASCKTEEICVYDFQINSILSLYCANLSFVSAKIFGSKSNQYNFCIFGYLSKITDVCHPCHKVQSTTISSLAGR
jgi:hypothetical protein